MRKEVRRFEAALHEDFYRLHSEANEAGWCFCVAWWVQTWAGWSDRGAEQNRQLREALCDQGEYDGYLLYADGAPAGWCQAEVLGLGWCAVAVGGELVQAVAVEDIRVALALCRVVTVGGRWPMPVNICGRVRVTRTDRRSVRAASTARKTWYCGRSPDPNAPPTKREITRILSGEPRARPRYLRTFCTPWVLS